MYAVHTTGSFFIKQDPYLGYIVGGTYDNGVGDWNQQYIVRDLFKSGSMIWTSKNDEGDVFRYERCDKVPDEIVKEASDMEEYYFDKQTLPHPEGAVGQILKQHIS